MQHNSFQYLPPPTITYADSNTEHTPAPTQAAICTFNVKTHQILSASPCSALTQPRGRNLVYQRRLTAAARWVVAAAGCSLRCPHPRSSADMQRCSSIQKTRKRRWKKKKAGRKMKPAVERLPPSFLWCQRLAQKGEDAGMGVDQ